VARDHRRKRREAHHCKIEVLADDDGVEDVESDGEGDLESEGEVKGVRSISVTADGHVVDTDLRIDHLDLTLAGNGDILLEGTSNSGDFDIGGNGDLEASDLVLQDLYVDLHGNGDASVTVENSIDGIVSGNGTLVVYGFPDGDVSVDGQGEVILSD